MFGVSSSPPPSSLSNCFKERLNCARLAQGKPDCTQSQPRDWHGGQEDVPCSQGGCKGSRTPTAALAFLPYSESKTQIISWAQIYFTEQITFNLVREVTGLKKSLWNSLCLYLIKLHGFVLSVWLEHYFHLLLFQVQRLSWKNRQPPEIKGLFVLLLIDPLGHANLLQFRISHSTYWLCAQLVVGDYALELADTAKVRGVIYEGWRCQGMKWFRSIGPILVRCNCSPFSDTVGSVDL